MDKIKEKRAGYDRNGGAREQKKKQEQTAAHRRNRPNQNQEVKGKMKNARKKKTYPEGEKPKSGTPGT